MGRTLPKMREQFVHLTQAYYLRKRERDYDLASRILDNISVEVNGLNKQCDEYASMLQRHEAELEQFEFDRGTYGPAN
jgi:hypothetical protein